MQALHLKVEQRYYLHSYYMKYELLYPHLLFVDLVEVLELVARSLNIQPIWRDQVWLSLDEMFRFLSRDVAKITRLKHQPR